eukprot:797925-Pyramimonas_sp.AAC.1
MYETAVAAKETAEEVSDYWGLFLEAWESGELETILMGLGWQGFTDSDSESDVSEGELILGTTVPDSDDEPDAKGLRTELQR